MSTMFWMITDDKTAKLGEPTNVNRGRITTKMSREEFQALSPDVRATLRAQWTKEADIEFRLFDDDGELYYVGVCDDLDNQDQSGAFEPLDWAMGDSGCTRMDYRKKGEKVWKTL